MACSGHTRPSERTAVPKRRVFRPDGGMDVGAAESLPARRKLAPLHTGQAFSVSSWAQVAQSTRLEAVLGTPSQQIATP